MPAKAGKRGGKARRARAFRRPIPQRPCCDRPGASRIGVACGLRRWASPPVRPRSGNSRREERGCAPENDDGAAHAQQCPMLALSSSAIKTDISAAPGPAPRAAASAQCLSRAGWQACVRAGTLVLSLHGDWSVRTEGAHARTPERLLEHPDVRAIVFDSSGLGSWDSSLLIFLSSLREASALHRVDFDESGLTWATRRHPALLRSHTQSPAATD